MSGTLAKGVNPSQTLFLSDSDKKNLSSAEIKTLLRKNILAQRKNFSLTPESSIAAQEAQQRILTTERWKKAQTVALYMPIRGELDTLLLLNDAFACGKTVLLPRCSPTKSGEMVFARCTKEDELVSGLFGIREPDPVCCPPSTTVPDLVIAPAVAMDRQGLRLGYGGGYYDRALNAPEWDVCYKVALVYQLQLVDALPREAWDAVFHGVVTEQEALWL